MPKKVKDLLLVMDVGNTNIVMGVYEGPVRLCDWRIRTERDVTLDELGISVRNLFGTLPLGLEQIGQMIISCVVPPMLNILEEFG
ncbi:MAG: pantothenate kinase, partial [Desulfobacca sp.]|nr:pantothenate kinase [Desulfobacca sp.]